MTNSQDQIIAPDRKEMVFISGGEFLMGCEQGYNEEKPVHRVRVRSFYMDKYLVTNKEYRKFCDETGKAYPENPRWKEMKDYFLNYPEYPVVNVSWEEAGAYAKWTGKRLPAEEEWEYAAHGGNKQCIYSWGDEEPEGSRANYADRNTDFPWRDFRYSTGYKYTSPAGIFQPNGYGLYDMAGNVWEWCSEEGRNDYSDKAKDTDALCWGKDARVCKGGCYHSSVFDLRITRRRRVLDGRGLDSVGFRCVCNTKDVPGKNVLYKETIYQIKWREELNTVSMKLKDDMELCMGVRKLTEKMAKHIKSLGFTSVEQYVTWETIESKGRDYWDFTMWDEQVKILKKVGLKWVPFLIAGSAYSLPDWYRESSDFEGLRCIEHNIESKIQSIWDKKFYQYVERYIAKFAEHYNKSNVLEALLLGITGDFGEAIFPDWHGNWPTQISGLYHSHAGYWCNDRFAQQDFKEKMIQKYGNIHKLNEAWNSTYNSIDSITLPEIMVDGLEGFRVDEHTNAGKYPIKNAYDRVRWIDFVDWYRDSMTNYAVFWMSIVRKYFPGTPIYLCTGGYAGAYHGSDFAQQCKIAAKYNGGVRITNETSIYASNFFFTNWISSASNFYNAYFGFEPAGLITEKGVVSRIYNATASGARNLHFYENNLFDSKTKVDTFIKNFEHLYTGKPRKEIGVFYPDVSIILSNVSSIEVGKIFGLIRDYTDFQCLEDSTIKDGILKDVKCIFICAGEFYRKKTIEMIINWVKEGGILIGYNVGNVLCFEDDRSYSNILFNMKGGEKNIGKGVSLYVSDICFFNESPSWEYLDMVLLKKQDNISFTRSLAYYQEYLFNPITKFLTKHGYYITDGVLDGIYTAKLESGILLLNTGDKTVQKKITLENGSKRIISIEGNSIVKI